MTDPDLGKATPVDLADRLPMTATAHRCTEAECPYVGQPSPAGCGCHKTTHQLLKERAAAVEQQVEYLRAALLRARKWCMGEGWDGGVAHDLRTWIDAGMNGPAPPARTVLTAVERAPAAPTPDSEPAAAADPDLIPFDLPPATMAIAKAFHGRLWDDIHATFFALWESYESAPEASRKAGSVIAHFCVGAGAKYALLGAQCAGATPRRDLWEMLTAQHFDTAVQFLAEAFAKAAAGGDDAGPETCVACGEALKLGDDVYDEINGGIIHAACCGPDRESYVDLDDGSPIGPDDPIPTPWKWSPNTDRTSSSDQDADA
ncbi:hypothetical protein OOZ54_13265 [Rhodopseudomonas palustris]|uniref:hypothetical protein n=1 Tax=Rhodopseudomonas palustris TaxID=1076 RepID=UPI0022F0AC67|nr:hypothetical protein [Rhodopseudomonas palustris]WBU27633.1 hypothetical protein OOZ54_13265 [Rhodopseudomonas palustris]